MEVRLIFCLCQEPKFGDTLRICVVFVNVIHLVCHGAKNFSNCMLGQFQMIMANPSQTPCFLLSDPQ